MSFSTAYARTHRALVEASREFDLTPIEAWIALALWDRDDSATTDELYDDFAINGNRNTGGSQIRRALTAMYAAGFAEGTSPSGGPRKRGEHTLVRLTQNGRALAARVLAIRDGIA